MDLAVFRTSNIEVGNAARSTWQCTGPPWQDLGPHWSYSGPPWQHHGPQRCKKHEVPNTARQYSRILAVFRAPWQYSGPRHLRSGILPGRPGSVPDLALFTDLWSRMLPGSSGIAPMSSAIAPGRSRTLPVQPGSRTLAVQPSSVPDLNI